MAQKINATQMKAPQAWFGVTGNISAPGEYNWTTAQTIDISSVPTGSYIHVGAFSYGGSGTNNTLAVRVRTNLSALADARQFGQYHMNAAISMTFVKASGDTQILFDYGGSINGTVRYEAFVIPGV